jgi:hypothetical protein
MVRIGNGRAAVLADATAKLYGHVAVATEIVCGLAFTAILTGLTFVRFSRPRAKLVFAPNPVVAMPSPDTSRHS